MATLILQAYDAARRPAWIDSCMSSVANWSAANGYDYCFTGDFFGRVPDWFRARCGTEMGPLTDLARVMLMAEHLASTERVVWIDADVLVFDRVALVLPDAQFFAIEEVCLLANRLGQVQIKHGVNGAVLGARHGDPTLAGYRRAIEAAVRSCPTGKIPRTLVGPLLLTAMGNETRIDCLSNVGLLTPDILAEIARGEYVLGVLLMHALKKPLAAANLCHFFGMTLDGVELAQFETMMGQAIERLLATRGDVLNRLLPN